MTAIADSSEVPAPAERARPDLRLVPAALLVWLGGLTGLLFGWWAATACGGAGTLLGLLLWFRYRDQARHRAAAGALLVCGVLVVAPLSLRLATAQHDPLRAAAGRGANAVITGEVAARPRPVHSAGYADRQAGTRSVVIPVDAASATVATRDTGSTGQVLLIAPVERWSELLPGQRVTVSGELAPADGAGMTVAVVFVRGPPAQVGPASWWQRVAASMRAGLRAACAVLPEEQAGLVPGLVVGDTAALPERVDREFVDAGMSHLTAVSGSNLAVVCGAVLLLLRLVRCGPRLSALAAGGALTGFVILVGPEPSVLRAGVMGAVGLLAMVLGRKGSALPALAASVCVLILLDPAMAASFGFALSVLATAGLVLLAPRWAGAMVRRGVPAGFAEGIAVPLAAFVVTAPVIAGMAGRLSLVSVAANLLAAPVVAPATVLGVLATAVAVFWPDGASFLVRLTGPEAGWLITVARRAAKLPGAVVPWPAGWLGGALAVVALLLVLLALRRRVTRILLALALVVALLVFVPLRVVAPAWPPSTWAVTACDVGQGDALALSTGEPGRAVVVDTGPEPGPVSDCLDRLNVDRVPLVILTHLHADHIGGLSSVFEGRSVGAIAVGPGRTPGWAWEQVAGQARGHGVPLLELEVGRALEWPGLRMQVIGPRYVAPQQDRTADGTGINNTSLVLRAGTVAGTALLTGDVELAAQADLLADVPDLRADILKVPHHGSRYSLPPFLDAVRPRLALISVGAGNSYGHPNRTTLDALGSIGALVSRTDTDGDTAVVPDRQGPALVRRGSPRAPP